MGDHFCQYIKSVLDHGKMPPNNCNGTVTYGGKCYRAEVLNYFLYGMLSALSLRYAIQYNKKILNNRTWINMAFLSKDANDQLIQLRISVLAPVIAYSLQADYGGDKLTAAAAGYDYIDENIFQLHLPINAIAINIDAIQCKPNSITYTEIATEKLWARFHKFGSNIIYVDEDGIKGK